jgi:hypothetical protein
MTLSSFPSKANASSLVRVWRVLKHEFLLLIPPTIFFIIGFNFIAFSTNLILNHYEVTYFVFATTSGLIVGKAVLMANKMPILRRFDSAPLIRPILFKTAVYWVCVFVARVLEADIRYLISQDGFTGLLSFQLERFDWHRFAFIQLWILVLFLIYVTGSELDARFGQGELSRIFFAHNSTILKLTRRQRLRSLVRLSRLARRHGEGELMDPNSPLRRELAQLITDLAAVPVKPAPPLSTGKTATVPRRPPV